MTAAVPFPSETEVDLESPNAAEVEIITRALATGASGPGGLTVTQRAVLNALSASMTGVLFDVAGVEPLGPDELAHALRFRNREFRTRIIQVMLLAELLLVPLPPEVSAQVEAYAERLGVGDDIMLVAREISHGSLGLALIDFERSGYFQHVLDDPPDHLHVSAALSHAWDTACFDEALYQRWVALAECPDGSLGQGVYRFYRARGFTYPGRAESAPPLLAQHDFVHVVAEYGSTVECEIEVFGLISRANDDPAAFSLLAMVLGLFETGYLHSAAQGFFEPDRGHLSADADRMAARLADAIYRGAAMATHLDVEGREHETDLLARDWFADAERPLSEIRADLGLPPRSEVAVAQGSVTPWERGGISPFQFAAGQRAAAESGEPYESYGASPGSDRDPTAGFERATERA